MLGGAISFANFGVHAVMTGIIVVVTRHTARATDDLHVFIRLFALLLVTLSVLTVAHIAEIEIWAIFFRSEGVFADPGVSAFEAAFENYTALGYGDSVPVPGKRIYGPLAALNGLLLIGWSVAIIFEVMRMADVQIGRHRRATR